MNYLKNISGVSQRYRNVKRGLSQYWLDEMVAHLQRVRRVRARLAGRDPLVALGVVGQVTAILRSEFGHELVVPGLNIVTNDGDLYYAELGAGETVTDDFTAGGLRLGSDNTAPTKTDTDVTTFLAGSEHAVDGTYPQTNDGDGDNTGAGTDIVTWRYSYTTAEGNVSNIIEGAIVDNTTTPTAALTHFLFAATFSKTSSDTLKVFVNHEFTGS